MHENDGRVLPPWSMWLCRGLGFLGLLVLPIALLYWLIGYAPLSLQPAGRVFACYVALPGAYAGMYWVLQRMKAPLQNFIWIVAISCAGYAFYEQHQAATTGEWRHWVQMGVGVLYAGGFAALAFWGWRRNRLARRAPPAVTQRPPG